MNKYCMNFVFGSVLLILTCSAASASDVSLHGFVQGNYARDTVTDNPDGPSGTVRGVPVESADAPSPAPFVATTLTS